MKPFQLHTTDLSPFGQRAKLALAVKGLLSQTNLISTFGGTQALGAMAPMRQIPILEHAGLRLPESQIIVDYLEDIAPDPPLLPDSAPDRARARLFARITDLYIAPQILTLIIGMRPPAQPLDMARACEQLNNGLGFAEHYLDPKTPYAIGGKLSLADLSLAPFLFFVPLLTSWHEAKAFPQSPRCAAYLKKIGENEHIAKAFAEMESAYKVRTDSFKRQEQP